MPPYRHPGLRSTYRSNPSAYPACPSAACPPLYRPVPSPYRPAPPIRPPPAHSARLPLAPAALVPCALSRPASVGAASGPWGPHGKRCHPCSRGWHRNGPPVGLPVELWAVAQEDFWPSQGQCSRETGPDREILPSQTDSDGRTALLDGTTAPHRRLRASRRPRKSQNPRVLPDTAGHMDH